ncbi:diguanylate cyclase [Dyella thiooxydans]|uniref:diguanylate cyclase n=1 Tax=Dyella thiooxydans TaxID=445710 RepID=A0A160N0V8_9GAMM|nr:diguanylate cyclase [Dyella thiooxydans]
MRIKDHRLFAQRLALLHRVSPTLTPAEQWQLKYLDALESSLDGNFAAATEPLRDVIDHSGDVDLAAKASAALLTNLTATHRYEAAFKLANEMTLNLPKLRSRESRFQTLGALSQMLNFAGQTELATKYAQMMMNTIPENATECDPDFKLAAALSNADKLRSSSTELARVIKTCTAAHEPVVTAAAELILSSLYLKEKQPSKALSVLNQINPTVIKNRYYPHLLSSLSQRAQAYEQLGQDENAKKAAKEAIAIAKPGEISGYLRSALEVLYKIARKEGNAADALNYYEQFVVQDKGYMNDLSVPVIAYQTVQQKVLTQKLEAESLSKQNRILTLQQELDAKAVETSRLYIVLLLIGLTGIVLWLLRLKHSQLRFKRMATRDGLTGILNHQHFINESERQLRHLERKSGHASLLWMDLDHFKQINDTHGHAAGDAVLRHIVAVCNDHLRPGDLFGRLGGEEFGILLLECERDHAIAIADRIRLAIEGNPLEHEGMMLKVSASVGIASTYNAGHALQRLCRQADAALYRAKRDGRNRVIADAGEGTSVFV